MIHVALFEPEIPPNTGNIARLCAATRSRLHIVGQPGFRMDDRAVRRAGLDYWDEVDIEHHLEIADLHDRLHGSRFVYFSTKGRVSYTDWQFQCSDCLVFGPETRGLPPEILESSPSSTLVIPMVNRNIRSLNLATSVGIAVYEAIRQIEK